MRVQWPTTVTPRVGLYVRTGIVCQQADTWVGRDILGMFGQRADEDYWACLMIQYKRGNRAEWVAIEFFR